MQRRNTCSIIALMLGVLLPHSIFCGDKMPSQEEGRFSIYVAGKEIGQEKFLVERASDSVSSKSTANFRDPAGSHESVQIETQLKMDGQYMPQTYQVRTVIGGRKQMIRGTLIPNQATFEYQTGGVPGKSGLLVGDRYVILDTNVFHHFIFIARQFHLSGVGKAESIEAVIPQEMDTGILKIIDVGTEMVSMRGKNRELHHLKADSGSLLIDLWIDEERVLYKIALPAKQLEIIRHF
jgi:hypothetical protein